MDSLLFRAIEIGGDAVEEKPGRERQAFASQGRLINVWLAVNGLMSDAPTICADLTLNMMNMQRLMGYSAVLLAACTLEDLPVLFSE